MDLAVGSSLLFNWRPCPFVANLVPDHWIHMVVLANTGSPVVQMFGEKQLTAKIVAQFFVGIIAQKVW